MVDKKTLWTCEKCGIECLFAYPPEEHSFGYEMCDGKFVEKVWFCSDDAILKKDLLTEINKRLEQARRLHIPSLELEILRNDLMYNRVFFAPETSKNPIEDSMLQSESYKNVVSGVVGVTEENKGLLMPSIPSVAPSKKRKSERILRETGLFREVKR